MDNLDATKEFFSENVKEINLLLLYSKRNKSNFLRYATFNKAALVLLCSKFESYLENVLEEYAYLHLKNSSNKNIDSHIYDNLVETFIDGLEQNKKNRVKRTPLLNFLVELCGKEELNPIGHYSLKAKFSYGKHGQKEVEKLLVRFGFASFTKKEIVSNFFKDFNSLNSIRNNIIHEDATPSLTDKDVEKYFNSICLFIHELDKEAVIKLTKVIKRKDKATPPC